MNRKIAEQLMQSLLALAESLNAAALVTDGIEDEGERKQFRRGLGEMMTRVYTDLMLPIAREYPDLDPDR